jgi:SAM-dependent methyltransferase
MVTDRVLEAEITHLPVGSALDLGCGTGKNSLKLAAWGWSVVGVDWAEHALELAREAAQAKQLDATFHAADITTWQPTQMFDLVISTYALPGGTASQHVLYTAIQALAPGGTLLVVEWDKSMSTVWGFDPDDLHSPEEIVNLLPGLRVESAEVRHIDDMFAGPSDPRAQAGSAANIALVRARRTATPP